MGGPEPDESSILPTKRAHLNHLKDGDVDDAKFGMLLPSKLMEARREENLITRELPRRLMSLMKTCDGDWQELFPSQQRGSMTTRERTLNPTSLPYWIAYWIAYWRPEVF